MFAADVGSSTATYRVHVELENGSGLRRPLPARTLGVPEYQFPRVLLISAYGGMDADAPFGFDDDTPARFEARMARFLGACVRGLASVNKLGDTRRVVVSLERTRPSPLTRRVGSYDLETRTFTHHLAAR
jgi:hypothetical protein